jgi:hypothetical protein
MVRAKRRPGRPRLGEHRIPLNQKVTARFSEEEFKMLEGLSSTRKERLSSLVRELVMDTLDEVRASLKKRGMR